MSRGIVERRGTGDEAKGELWRERLAEGRLGEAYAAYLAVEAQLPEVRSALENLADFEALVRARRWVRAEQRLARTVERPEIIDWGQLESDLAALTACSKALDRRELADAVVHLERVRSACFRAEVANLRGTAHAYEGDNAAAKVEFERAVTLDPKHYRALTNLGNAQLEEGLTDEAIVNYQRAIALNDDFANAHHNLGVAYRRKGQIGKSVRALRTAQRAQQRRDQEEAREALGGTGRGAARMLRWVLILAVAAALFLLLRNRGLI